MTLEAFLESVLDTEVQLVRQWAAMHADYDDNLWNLKNKHSSHNAPR